MRIGHALKKVHVYEEKNVSTIQATLSVENKII